MSDNNKQFTSVFSTLSLQYFFYFSVLGIFLPYFNLYCYHLDFSGFQIGILSAIRTISTVVFPIFWGIIADRLKIRRHIYIACSIISSLVWAFFLFTIDFRVMLVISILYGIFYSPIISFLEAITMEILGPGKKKYGKIRVWGSIGFIIFTMSIGRLIDIYTIGIIISLILAGSLLQAIFSFKIPATGGKSKTISFRISVLLKFRLIIFLICAFLMLFSHGTYYGFFSIHLENLGYGKTFIGGAWALASIAEILVMIKSDAIFKRVSFEKTLLFSFFVAAVRWLILSSGNSPLIILFSQILHAITYGAFHIASILYIDTLVPSQAKTFGQAVNNAVSYGLGITAGFVMSGYFFEEMGSSGLFVLSSIIAALGGVLLAGILILGGKTNKTH